MNEISYQNSYKISEGSFTKFLFNELSEVNKKLAYESLELTGFLFSLLINYKVYKKDYMGAVNLIYRVDKLVDKMLSTTEKEGSNGGGEPFYYIWPSFGPEHYHQLSKVSLSNNFIVSTVHSEKIVGCYLLYKDYNNSSKGAFNLYFFINKRASSVSSKSLIFEGLKLDEKYMNTIHNVIIEKLKQTNRVESQFIITSSSNLYKSCDNGLNMDIMECDSGILKHFLYNVAQPETICNIKYYDAEIFNEISNNQERFLNLVRTFLEYEFGKTLREKNIKLIYNALDTLIKKSNLNYTILDFCEGLPERISSLFLRVMIL